MKEGAENTTMPYFPVGDIGLGFLPSSRNATLADPGPPPDSHLLWAHEIAGPLLRSRPVRWLHLRHAGRPLALTPQLACTKRLWAASRASKVGVCTTRGARGRRRPGLAGLGSDAETQFLVRKHSSVAVERQKRAEFAWRQARDGRPDPRLEIETRDRNSTV
ncbi:hypothetical protein BDW60DRAFT_185682 [Aspergillus nidulans var. acristatus]